MQLDASVTLVLALTLFISLTLSPTLDLPSDLNFPAPQISHHGMHPFLRDFLRLG